MLYIVDQVIIMATPMIITQQCGCLFYLMGTPPKRRSTLSFLGWKSEVEGT